MDTSLKRISAAPSQFDNDRMFHGDVSTVRLRVKSSSTDSAPVGAFVILKIRLIHISNAPFVCMRVCINIYIYIYRTVSLSFRVTDLIVTRLADAAVTKGTIKARLKSPNSYRKNDQERKMRTIGNSDRRLPGKLYRSVDTVLITVCVKIPFQKGYVTCRINFDKAFFTYESRSETTRKTRTRDKPRLRKKPSVQ